MTMAALLAAPAASAYPGDLDTSFNSTGYRVTPFPAGNAEAADVAVQGDGKVVAVGTAYGSSPGSRQFAVARYDADGTMDETFGTGGLVTTPLGESSSSANAVAVQPDGKIVVGGMAWLDPPGPAGPAHSFALARYDTTGTLDPGFGTGGKVVTYIAGGGDFCPGVEVSALALRGGQIYAAGGGPCSRRGYHPFIARYNDDGTLDPAYGTNEDDSIDGIAHEGQLWSSVRDMVLTPDGAAIVVGANGNLEDSTIIRFTPGGALDTGFGDAGAVERQGSLVSLVAAAGNRIVTLTGDSALLARFDSTTGALDTSFGSNGTAGGSILARDLAQDADGRLLVVAPKSAADPSGEARSHVALQRWSADGVLDRHFGTKSQAVAWLGGDADPRALAVDPSGRPVAAGTWYADDEGPPAFVAARFLGGTGPNRAPSASFTWTPSPPHRGESIIFDATASDDPDGPIANYSWDLDGSGNFASNGGESPYLSGGISFPEPGTYTVRLRVRDVDGATTETSRTVTVIPWPWDPPPGGGTTDGGGTPTETQQPPPRGEPAVTIAGGARFTRRADVTLAIAAPPGATLAEVANDGDFRGAARFAVVPGLYPWRLEADGPERIPRKVYVRFHGNSAVPPTEVFTDTIVLDDTAPRLLPPVLASYRKGVATIRVSAADRTSGIAGIQVTANRQRPGALRKYRRRLRFRAARGAAVYVRAVDGAGNTSGWRRARRP